MQKRRELSEANSNLIGVVMKEKEIRLNGVLSELKKEYKESCGGEVHYSVPVLTDRNLCESRLYRFCTLMPKGADLHVHDLTELPVRELCRVLSDRPEIYINTDRKSYDLKRFVPGETVPDGYIMFSEALNEGIVSEDELIENWTVLGAEKNSVGIWQWFEELFCKHAVLSDNREFAEAFYEKAFRYYVSRGIYHIEIHLLLTEDLDACAEYIKTVRDVYYRVKDEFPFFSVKIIGAGVKADTDRLEYSKKCFLNTLYAKENIKDCYDPEHISDFVIGFDLVNEEDTNLPLKDFAPMLLKARKLYPDMKLFIHSGESLDANNDNLIDAYLLGVARVGHGLNLYRFPDLLERYAKSEICLEVCVISNQTLGYTRDIRNHPAAEYLRRGVPVALCSDDPLYQENETLTDDFFAAALCWDLSIADLKQLAINSIMYSGLDNYEKHKLMTTFNEKWNEFVDLALNIF